MRLSSQLGIVEFRSLASHDACISGDARLKGKLNDLEGSRARDLPASDLVTCLKMESVMTMPNKGMHVAATVPR